MDINKRDFQAVIRHMLEVDRPAAMKAIADEFAREIAREPEVVAEAERKGREQVKELAGEKYIAAPIGRDENEKAVYDATQELVKELEGKTSKTA